MRCVTETHTNQRQDILPGEGELVREISHTTNDETDSNAGRVIETPDAVNDKIDCSTGRIRERERDSPADEQDGFQHGACKRKSPSAKRRDRFLREALRDTPYPPNEHTDFITGRVRETSHQP